MEWLLPNIFSRKMMFSYQACIQYPRIYFQVLKNELHFVLFNFYYVLYVLTTNKIFVYHISKIPQLFRRLPRTVSWKFHHSGQLIRGHIDHPKSFKYFLYFTTVFNYFISISQHNKGIQFEEHIYLFKHLQMLCSLRKVSLLFKITRTFKYIYFLNPQYLNIISFESK